LGALLLIPLILGTHFILQLEFKQLQSQIDKLQLQLNAIKEHTQMRTSIPMSNKMKALTDTILVNGTSTLYSIGNDQLELEYVNDQTSVGTVLQATDIIEDDDFDERLPNILRNLSESMEVKLTGLAD